MLKAVKDYLELNFPIFPLVAGDKRPAVKWATATFSITDFKKNSNIGLRIGEEIKISGKQGYLMAIDFDLNDKALLQQYCEYFHLPKSTVQKTGGSHQGYHLYYLLEEQPKKIPSLQYENATIDFYGKGAYCVIAPSKVQSEYKMLRPFSEIQFLPGEIYTELIEHGRKEKTRFQTLKKYVAKLPPAGTGERNNSMISHYGKMVEMNIKISPRMAKWAISEWNSKNPEPLADYEIEAMIEANEDKFFSRRNDKTLNKPAKKGSVKEKFADESLVKAAEQAAAEKDNNAFNELVQAETMQKKLGLKRFKGIIYQYQNGVYVPLDKYDLRRIVGAEIKAYNVKFAALARINSVMTLIETEADKIDQEDSRYINLKNGLYDIEEDKLVPHSADIMSFNQLPITYDEKAKCVKWKEFILYALNNDKEAVQALQRFFGYTMLADCTQQKALWLYGVAGSGKSTIAEVLTYLIGENNSVSADIGNLTETFGLAPLLGKKLAWFDEIDAQRFKRAEESLLKRLVANSPVSVRQMQKIAETIKLNLKSIMSTNKLPLFNDLSDGFSRRFIILPFYNVHKSQDPYFLDDLINNELAGIFNWALEGARRYLETRQLIDPTVSRKLKNEHKSESNPLLEFFNEVHEVGATNRKVKFIVGDGGRVNIATIFDAYKKYSDEMGDRYLMNKNGLSRKIREMMMAHKVENVKSNGNSYLTNIKELIYNEDIEQVSI